MLKGFTLLESIVALAIISFITALAIPFAHNFIALQSINSDLSKVTYAIESARTYAIKTRQDVTICGLDNTDNCHRDWKRIIVLDHDNQAIYRADLSNNYHTVTWSAFQKKPTLTIKPNGFTRHQNGTLYLCHKSDPNLHRAILINKTARTRIQKATENIMQKCLY